MGIHFGNLEIEERVILTEWLVQVGTEELEHRLRESTQIKIALSNREKLFLITCVVGLAAIIAGALAYFGVRHSNGSYALEGDTNKADAAYQDFLTRWKDADPDIPIFIAAQIRIR